MARPHLSPRPDPTIPARARSNWEIIRRVATYLRPYPWMALGTIVCALLSLGLSFVYPQITQYVIDEVIGQRSRGQMEAVAQGVLQQRADQLTWLMLGLL